MTPGLSPKPLHRLIEALHPWLGNVVFVGGCAHTLYHQHASATRVNHPPLATLDVDIALGKLGDGQDIAASLRNHGFTEEFHGDARPPATHYRLGNEASGFYAEFLTPLTGSTVNRTGRRKTTAEIGGVAAQQLRHVGLLLHSPWLVRPEGLTIMIQVANPVSFLAQKMLIHRARNRTGRAKDILYIHDTLAVFGSQLTAMAELWRTDISPALGPKLTLELVKIRALLFSTVSDDIRRAALISAERTLSPDDVREVCNYGLSLVFPDG